MSAHVGYGNDWKEMQNLYVCENNVWVGAKELYACENGVWGLVWPTGAKYGNTCDLLADGMLNNFYFSSDSYGTREGSITTTQASTGWGTCLTERTSWSTSTSLSAGMVWGRIEMDTRGYGYILVSWGWVNYTGNSGAKYMCPFISYNEESSRNWGTITSNNVHANSVYDLPTNNSTSSLSTTNVLFDITNMQQESTNVYFGMQVSNYTDNAPTGAIYITSLMLYKDKPSTSVACEVVWS